MTLSTSAVAVCCLSASGSSPFLASSFLDRRRLDCDDGLVGERLQDGDLRAP